MKFRTKIYVERRKAAHRLRQEEFQVRRLIHHSNRQFIAWDGEGINACGTDEPCGEIYNKGGNNEYRNHKPDCHRYVLLMNSVGGKIVDMNGISTKQALKFICETGELFPDAIHVIYGGSYDVNMILKDLKRPAIERLVKKKACLYDDYRIEYVSRKYVKITRRERMPYAPWNKRPVINSVTIYDAIGFFQGSFVKNLKKCLPSNDGFDIKLIEEGKKRRGEFTEEDIKEFVARYTQEELKALVKLMEYLRGCFIGANIHMRRWDGSGAAASAVLREHNVKSLYWNDFEQGPMPDGVEHAMQVGYGGGRSEMCKWGYTNRKVYHYDIISAYPSVMPLLPALYGGFWIHGVGEGVLTPLTPWTLYKIYWDYEHTFDKSGKRLGWNDSNDIYPFFYRQPWREPRVFYPPRGYSWVWEPELSTALKWQPQLKGKIVCFEKWQFVPNPYITDRPFSFVPEMFELRQKYKEEGNGAQLALKLVINTLYGKTAQTKGYKLDDRGNLIKPPYYSLFYAGLITSYTRAKVYDAAMQQPSSIIAFATDGLWSTTPLKLDIGNGLGQWEAEELDSYTSVQAGVYFYTKDGEQGFHYRGFNQGSIEEWAVADAWENSRAHLVIPTRRFVTMGSAIASQERFDTHWHTWDNSPRILQVVPGNGGKRIARAEAKDYWQGTQHLMPADVEYPHWFAHNIHSEADLTEEYLSKPHPLPWEENQISEKEQDSDVQREESIDLAEQDDSEIYD